MKKIFLILLFSAIANLSQALEIGDYPSLVVKTFDEKIFDLEAKKGKIIIVNFWASWCLECREELVVLDEVYQKYKQENLEIIAINIEKKRKKQKAQEIISGLSYQGAMMFDVVKNNFEEPDLVPLIYVVDKKGAIVFKAKGKLLKKDEIEKLLD